MGIHNFLIDSLVILIDFLIDNIFVQFGGLVFQQMISIPMCAMCAPLHVTSYLKNIYITINEHQYKIKSFLVM